MHFTINMSDQKQRNQKDSSLCPYCTFVAPSSEVLRAHKYTTHRDMDCPYCGKLLATWWAYERHINRFHDDEIPVAVRKKQKEREASEKLSAATINKCGRRRKIQVCETCKQVFKSRPALTYHIAIYHSNEVHACDQCSAVFPHAMLLKSHVLRHGERTVMCHRCGRKFFTQKQLNSHENVFHRRACSYSCKICKQQFSTLRALQHHMKTQPHEKYNCQECGISFIQKQEYISHVVTHGLRCIPCKISFASPVAAHKHYRSAHTNVKSSRKSLSLPSVLNQVSLANNDYKREAMLPSVSDHVGQRATVQHIQTDYNQDYAPKEDFNSLGMGSGSVDESQVKKEFFQSTTSMEMDSVSVEREFIQSGSMEEIKVERELIQGEGMEEEQVIIIVTKKDDGAIPLLPT